MKWTTRQHFDWICIYSYLKNGGLMKFESKIPFIIIYSVNAIKVQRFRLKILDTILYSH